MSLLQLNNYDYSSENLHNVARFLTTGELPPGLEAPLQRRFARRYSPDRFAVRNGRVYYKPRNLELVPKERRLETLERLYNDDRYGTGAGIKSLYDKVAQQYAGITRKEVAEFLRAQPAYQVSSRPPETPVNRPVSYTAQHPNHMWFSDILDLERYAGYNKRKKYLLVVIDAFSKYVFGRALANRSSASVARAFDSICSEAGVTPKILITDNGKEYLGAFGDWCATHNVQHNFTRSHTPQSNGISEATNRFLRRMIREGFVRRNNLDWVSHVADYITNRNNTKHSRLRRTPTEIWTPTADAIPRRRRSLPTTIVGDKSASTEEIQREVARRSQTHARRELARYRDQQFAEGDRVRIDMRAISGRVRKAYKAGDGKLISVRWSPDVYTVVRAFKPRNHLGKAQYQTSYGATKFFASELQRVDAAAEAVAVDADKLNFAGEGRRSE